MSVLNIPPKSLDGNMLVEGGISLWRSGRLGYFSNVTSCQSSRSCLNSWNDAMMAQACSSAVPSRAMIEQYKQIDFNAQSLSNIPMKTLTRDFCCWDVSYVWICFKNCSQASQRVARVLDVLASTVRILRMWLQLCLGIEGGGRVRQCKWQIIKLPQWKMKGRSCQDVTLRTPG